MRSSTMAAFAAVGLMRLIITWMALFSGLSSLVSTASFGQEEQALRICTTLYSQGINDVHNVYTDQEHFERFKQLIADLHLKTYSDIESAGASLGMTVPALGDLLGLDASAKNSSEKFQQELANFMSSSWGQVQSRFVNRDMNSTISSALLETYRDCERNYFSTLQSRLRQVITVIPDNPPSGFILSLRAFFPSGTANPTLQIYSIEPTSIVHCTFNGEPAPSTYDSSEISLYCTKPKDQAVNLAVNTNAGTAGGSGLPLTIPAARDPASVENDRIAQLEARLEGISLSG